MTKSNISKSGLSISSQQGLMQASIKAISLYVKRGWGRGKRDSSVSTESIHRTHTNSQVWWTGRGLPKAHWLASLDSRDSRTQCLTKGGWELRDILEDCLLTATQRHTRARWGKQFAPVQKSERLFPSTGGSRNGLSQPLFVEGGETEESRDLGNRLESDGNGRRKEGWWGGKRRKARLFQLRCAWYLLYMSWPKQTGSHEQDWGGREQSQFVTRPSASH